MKMKKKWLNILNETDVIAKPIHFDDNNKNYNYIICR